MNRMKKSGIALLMAFMLCIRVIPVYAVNASDDTSKPQIESVVFHDDGKTVKEYDEVSFTVKSNIAASDISYFMVGFSTEDYGIGSMASFEEVDINTYLVSVAMLKYLFYCMANKPSSASLLKLISYKKNTGSETLEVPDSICCTFQNFYFIIKTFGWTICYV